MDFASQILCNAMAATMAPIFCIELSLYRKEINGQGPCLLHYVLMLLTEVRKFTVTLPNK